MLNLFSLLHSDKDDPLGCAKDDIYRGDSLVTGVALKIQDRRDGGKVIFQVHEWNVWNKPPTTIDFRGWDDMAEVWVCRGFNFDFAYIGRSVVVYEEMGQK